MQESIKQRMTIFLVVIVAAIAFLIPTFAPEKFRGKEGMSWISKPISLGLDLSGGVHLVYEVQTIEAVKSRLLSMAQRMRSDLRDEKIATTKASVNDKNQIELVLLSAKTADKAKDKIQTEMKEAIFVEQVSENDRVKLLYSLTPKQIDFIQRESVKQAVETLRNRVDQFGVAEPLIQQSGINRITLQMPGVSDIQAVKNIVGKTAKLEFRLVPAAANTEGSVKMKKKEGGFEYVEDQPLMTGDAVAEATVLMPQGKVEVALSFTPEGAKLFRKITEENVGRQLAIILDGLVYSSPVIREAIGGGQATISGGFSIPEASQLAIVLRSGALPAPLSVLEERTVGPTLGKESIQKGMVAILIGFIAICIFMSIYYGKSGTLASVSLGLNLFLLVAILSAFGATLTLPGLAGLALTAGMAVDSNVIIFERIRDELRIGATRDAAVSSGFEKAMSAILDSNLTTLVSGIVLYALGSGAIRGFAVTLSIGIATTIYCATFASRLGFDYFQLKGKGEKELSI